MTSSPQISQSQEQRTEPRPAAADTSASTRRGGFLSRAARALVATGDDTSPILLRLTLALVFFPHGAQKLLGWFGGGGFTGTMEYMTGAVGLPALIVLAVIGIEFLAPFALATGFLTRAAALGVGAIMVGAVATTHLPNGFFMNWTGAQAGEGFEYHLLVIGIVLALLVTGGGKWSVDRRLAATDAADGGPALLG